MKLENISTASLIPYARNSKTHSDAQVSAIAGSIREFGFTNPVLISDDLTIVAGHGRVLAAQKLGLGEVPCIRLSHLSDNQRRAYVIADNRLAEVGASWDLEMLTLELESFDHLEFDPAVFEFDELFKESEEETKEVVEAVEDDFDEEPPEEPKTKLGDLYEIGPHRLLCGDSTKREDIERLMNGEKAELLFTSPPYSDMRDYNGSKDLTVGNISNFIPTWEPFAKFQVVNLGIQRKDYEIVPYWDDYILKAKNCGMKLLSWNVWDKGKAGSVAQATSMFTTSHEWIFVFGKEAKKLNRTIENQLDKYEARHGKDWDKGVGSTTRRQKDGSMFETSSATYTHHQLHTVIQQTPELGHIRKSHPAMFPVGLPLEYIKAMTNPDDIVAESFTGSGTTMVAAHQLSRRCYGIELDPKYCDVIVRRLKALDPALTVKLNGIDVTDEW
jgi:DNA modification methylase